MTATTTNSPQQANRIEPINSPIPAIKDVILSHFDGYQRLDEKNARRVDAATMKLRRAVWECFKENTKKNATNRENQNTDPNSKTSKRRSKAESKNGNTLDGIREEMVEAVLQCVDAAFTATASPRPTENATNAADLIFELAAAFCAAPDFSPAGRVIVHHELSEAIWSRAVQASVALLEHVRANGCRLIGLCLSHLRLDRGEGESSKEKCDGDQRSEWIQKCHETSSEALLPRLTDKARPVRTSAIKACAFFFSNVNKIDKDSWSDSFYELEDALLNTTAHESYYANRVEALMSVGVSEETLPSIVERIRDVKLQVRVEALETLKKKAEVTSIPNETLVEILRAGLTERCPATMEATSKLLCCSWLKSLKFDPLQLLKLLDPVSNEMVCENTMKTILSVALNRETTNVLDELSEPECRAFREEVLRKTSLESEDLDPSRALLLRIRCSTIFSSDMFTSMQKADEMAHLVPDLLVLCDVLQKHLGLFVAAATKRAGKETSDDESYDADEQQEDEQCFVCVQLLNVARLSDLKEEAGQRHFLAFMHSMLCSSETPDDLVEPAVRVVATMHRSELDFLESVSSALGEVYSGSFEQTEENELPSRQMRALAVISVVLEHTHVSADNHILQNFRETILSCIVSSNAVIREASVSCIGKYALLGDAAEIAELKPILINIAGDEKEIIEVRAQAVLALCDMALLHESVMAPNVRGEDKKETLCLHNILTSFLNHKKEGLTVIASEACMKLLMAGRMKDSAILARLIVIFFDIGESCLASDDNADEAMEVGSPLRLEQLLSFFFPAYSLRSTDSRADMLGSINHMLRMVEQNKRGTRGLRNSYLPVGKMIEYICSTVDTCEESELNSNDGEKDAFLVNGISSHEYSAASKLHALVSLSEFLREEHVSLSIPYLRSLCKVFGAANVDHLFTRDNNESETLDKHTSKLLRRLQKNIFKFNVDLTDQYSLNSTEDFLAELDSVIGAYEENISIDEDEKSCGPEDNRDCSEDETISADDGDTERDDEACEDGQLGGTNPMMCSNGNKAKSKTRAPRSSGSRRSGSTVDSLQSLSFQ